MSEIRRLLELHAGARPEAVVFSFHVDGASRQVTFRELLRDVTALSDSMTPHPGCLEFIGCETRYPNIVRYLAAIARGEHPAFLAPLTPRTDPEIYRRELQTLVSRFRPRQITGFEALSLPGPQDSEP